MSNDRFFKEKEVIWINKLYWNCPTCSALGVFSLTKDLQPKYCSQCGQKLKFPVKPS